MGETKIDYVTKAWNPVVGCSPAGSPGCLNCWARELHNRRHKAFLAGKKMPAQYAKPFSEVQCLPERVAEPLHWWKSQRVAVAFSGDLFHADVPDEFLDSLFAVMALARQHRFLILTKRPERMKDYLARLAKSIKPLELAARNIGRTFKFRGMDGREYSILPWPIPNLCLGTSCSTQADADRNVPDLLRCSAAVRFLSVEPLIEYVDFRFGDNLEADEDSAVGCRRCDCGGVPHQHYISEPCHRGIDWVIVGAESGPHRRPCKLDWIRSIRDQCQAVGIALFVKQADIEGRLVKMPMLDGRVWSEFPLEAESKTETP